MLDREDLIVQAGKGLGASWLVMQNIHRIFGTPAPTVPEAQKDFYKERRAVWIEEEVEELREAGDDLVGQADAYLDIIVFALGGLVELGIDPGKLYEIVIRSQYAKLWEDGLPRVRETDGKWIKPPGWEAPEALLEQEINKQVINAS